MPTFIFTSAGGKMAPEVKNKLKAALIRWHAPVNGVRVGDAQHCDDASRFIYFAIHKENNAWMMRAFHDRDDLLRYVKSEARTGATTYRTLKDAKAKCAELIPDAE